MIQGTALSSSQGQGKNGRNKSARIREFIQGEIQVGRFAPGDRLPSESELAQMFEVNKNTAVKAMNELALRGVVVRQQGRGTFVADGNEAHRAPAMTNTAVALFVSAGGHVYQDQTRVILQTLQAQGLYGTVIETGHFTLHAHEAYRRCVRQILEQGSHGLLIDGKGSFPFEELIEREENLPPMAFINGYDCDHLLPAVYVLTDPFAGARLATRHLLDLGHRNILLAIHNDPKIPPLGTGAGYYRYIDGYREALREREEDARARILKSRLTKGDFAPLRKALTSRDRPTAVLTGMDIEAKYVFDLAKALGLRVPEDLAIVGYYNTPWAEALEVPLTSVSIQPETIARTAAEHLLALRGRRPRLAEKIIIQPQLVVRDSCGAGREAAT